MANVEKLIELRDFLKQLDEDKFNYAFWAYNYVTEYIAETTNKTISMLNECNTCGCIAGWGLHLASKKGIEIKPAEHPSTSAKKYLELEHEEYLFLFYGGEGSYNGVMYEEYQADLATQEEQKQEAIKRLNALIEYNQRKQKEAKL